ncbi:hypothetical protein E3O42_08065 [Cryobacterium adonitolivorans]|uniref:ABC transporter ATP-binding protein n=1 Tax=Cryobacterium adonitolivorans TaxID=1259189 RepID=A0A4R8W8P0_9MICO|nr:hypothetical protein [Cryobacterium adonitolivorans]TFC02697.1 hypothetical protein E3O42_08065 [Cryobacterium adonitolivorans]
MTQNTPHKPSRSEILKPVELVAISAGMGLFVGLTILLATRNWALSSIALGITFIVALVVIAMLALGMKPDAAEKSDLDEQNQTGEPPAH